MTIQRKASKRKAVKKVSKRKPVKRRNPDKNAYEYGYEDGVSDIEEDQWQLHDIYQAYAALINSLLKKEEFNGSVGNYQEYILGYIQAKIDYSPTKELETDFKKVRTSKNFINPLLGDHSRALQLIYQDTNTDSSISRGLNQGGYYSLFIIDNLLKFGYITKRLNRYELTSKGNKVVKNIKLYRLEPNQYNLMKDVQDYLSK